jgi:Uma2 family endonuclease
MAAAPQLPLVSVEEYLETSYPDGDREYIDGCVVRRNVGTPGHSTLQKILVVHLARYEKELRIAVYPEGRTRISEARFRVPDVAVFLKPVKQTSRVLQDVPFVVVEVLSPDDRMGATLVRFADYEALGVPHILQLDPERRRTHLYRGGALTASDVEGFQVPERGWLPFDSRALLAELDSD